MTKRQKTSVTDTALYSTQDMDIPSASPRYQDKMYMVLPKYMVHRQYKSAFQNNNSSVTSRLHHKIL